MSLQDLLSDYVARLNNAVLAKKPVIQVLKNRVVVNVSKKLTSLGYIESFEDTGNNILLLTLNLNRMNRIFRISKPGHRVYIAHNKIPKIIGGKGFNIISSSKGIITHVESNKEKLGGELLFQIY